MRRRFILVGVVAVTLVAAFGGIYEWKYANKAYFGVNLAGVSVGGKRDTEIEKALAAKTSAQKSIKLIWGTSRFEIPYEQIGLEYDLEQSARTALRYGRSGKVGEDIKAKFGLLGSNSASLPLDYYWDENKLAEAISEIETQINIPAREPEFLLAPDGKSVVVTNGENGQEMDKRQLIADIRSGVAAADGREVAIDVKNISPKLSLDQLDTAKTRAESFVDKKLTIVSPIDQQIWNVDLKQFFVWIDPTGDGYKTHEIESFAKQVASSVNREPQNASFRFVSAGRVEEFKPAHDGYKLPIDLTADQIELALLDLESGAAEKKLELTVERTSPGTQIGDVNDLGIKELIGKGESWFSGSITNRIFNLQKAAAELNGRLVPPGETFSFNKTVGEISAATGYKQAYVIKDGKTILGDGGGVCQVSSTLFRAVLNAGLPIDERIAHAYRVHYYEEKYQVGFDATIFQPSPDFKFRNDTNSHILIQTEFDEKNKHLTFSLYGTGDGRVATVSKSRIWDVVAPPAPLYQDDPTLPVGRVVQTEHAATGAKVAFDWKVTRNGETLQERTFYSNYRPWQAVYLRGTKTN